MSSGRGSGVVVLWLEGSSVLTVVGSVDVDVTVDASAVMEESPAVEVWNWKAPRKLVVTFGAVALLQQLLWSLGARQQ
jgi:hypothetical protein